jgi:hypothetical protein
MIFAKYGGNSIHRLSFNDFGSATISTISNAEELNGPVGLAFGDNGDLYVGNYEDREIYRVLSDGSLQYIATVGDSSFLGFIDFAQGMLWGTVLGENKIFRINPNGIDDVTLFAGSVNGTTDGDINVATFAAPNGIKFNDLEDTMYISEFNSKNIRIISGISLSIMDFENNNNLKVITNSNQKYIELVSSIFLSENYEIILFNHLGQKIFEQVSGDNSSDRIHLKTNNFSKGTYIIKVQSDAQLQTKKVIIN